MQIFTRMLLPFVIVTFVLLSGCSKPVSLVSQDVSGFVWLRGDRPLEDSGFYAHPDGHLLPLNNVFPQGDFWEVNGNALIINNKQQASATQGQARYFPALINDEIILVREESDRQAVYQRFDKEPLQSDVKFSPVSIMAALVETSDDSVQMPYLQFDTEGGVVRGFGGVNNFRGNFQISQDFNIKIGPIMATRMAGPGMDIEIELFQCLDQADGFLSIKDKLIFYRGHNLLCSFSR